MRPWALRCISGMGSIKNSFQRCELGFMSRRGAGSKAEHTRLVQLSIQKKDGHWVGLLAIEKCIN